VNHFLNHKFQELEKQREQLMSQIISLTEKQINDHEPGKWSIAEILSHLISSEQLSVNYLNKKILGIADTSNTGLAEEMKMIIFVISQRLPLKFKAPKKVVDNTPQYNTLEGLTTAWSSSRQELFKVLEKFDDHQLKKKIFRHPLVGMLNIQQTLRFFNEHIIHHTPQIKRQLK
jgi:uncharacterized damage-inducible protein DinB